MHAHIGVAKQAIYKAGDYLGRIRNALYEADRASAEKALTSITNLHGQVHQALDAIESWLREPTEG